MMKHKYFSASFFFSANTLQKKWKNLRDNFSKELKRQKDMKSGSGAGKRNPYIYFHRLQFIEKVVANNTTISNLSGNDQFDHEPEIEDLQPGPSKVSAKKFKTNTNNMDKQLMDILHKSVELREKRDAECSSSQDEDKLFCLSLYKELLKVPEHGRITVKIQLLQTLQRAQSFYNPLQEPPRYPAPTSQGYSEHLNNYNTQPVNREFMPQSALSPTDSIYSENSSIFSDIYKDNN